MTWRAQLRQPVDLTVKLIEDLVFGTELDAALRAGLKNRQSVESILSTAPLFDFIEEIEKGLDESRKESVDQAADEKIMTTSVRPLTTLTEPPRVNCQRWYPVRWLQ